MTETLTLTFSAGFIKSWLYGALYYVGNSKMYANHVIHTQPNLQQDRMYLGLPKEPWPQALYSCTDKEARSRHLKHSTMAW